MVNQKKQTFAESDVSRWRRGRPAGKNRIPLSREERRARNAQYERERRNETAEVMSQLIEAANCDPNVRISNAELLATVINRIQRMNGNKSESITDLERINAKLEAQIVTLQDRLGLDNAALELLDGEDTQVTDAAGPSSKSLNNSNNCNNENYNLRKQKGKRKRPKQLISESIKPDKQTKTQSEICSVDSGIEMKDLSYHHTVPPSTVCEQDQNNMQYLVQTEQQELPVEITEEQDHGESQKHMELQPKLYNQIYNSESQSSVEAMTELVVASLSAQSQSFPAIKRLARSLIVIPSIVPPQQVPPQQVPPQQVPPDSQEHSQSDLTSPQNVELPSDIDLTNECDFLQQNDDQEPNLDLLTDAEKKLLSDWIDALETS